MSQESVRPRDRRETGHAESLERRARIRPPITDVQHREHLLDDGTASPRSEADYPRETGSPPERDGRLERATRSARCRSRRGAFVSSKWRRGDRTPVRS